MRGPLGVRWIYVYAISQRCCLQEGELKSAHQGKRPQQKWGLISLA